jgi:glycerol kinase
MDITTLQWSPVLLNFFSIKPSILPKIVSSSEVYGELTRGVMKGVKIGGLVGDQQGALVGNKCLRQGEAKCTYGTGAFLLFCTGSEIVRSTHGLLSTVSFVISRWMSMLCELGDRSHSKLGRSPNPFMHWKAVVSTTTSCNICSAKLIIRFVVAVAGSAIKWYASQFHHGV